VGLDRVAYPVDATSVERLEEPRLHAEGLGDVSVDTGAMGKIAQRRVYDVGIDLRGVGLDVTAREHVGVAGRVDRSDVNAAALELLRDARRPGEQVERRTRAHRAGQLPEHRHEAALRPDVLDHP